jgi:hypothetical protein
VRIKVKSAEVQERQITRSRDNKQFTFREQQGLVAMGDEVRAIVIGLGDKQAPFPPGDYELLDRSFYVDRNGHLAVGRLELKPIASAVSPGARQAG